MKKIYSLTTVILLSASYGFAQQAVSTAGGNASGNGGSASYTVGQVAYTEAQSSEGSISQGVQQAYVITTQSGSNIEEIQLSCATYPNPVVDQLTLKIENINFSNISYQLIDVNGKVLDLNPVTKSESIIEMTAFVKGIYILKVLEEQKELKTFKIIKQ